MTDDTIVPTPNHRDRERALRGVLARMSGDDDVLPLLASECESPVDVDMMIVACFDSLVKVLMLKTSDPLSYLTQWIALERQLADAEMGRVTGEAINPWTFDPDGFKPHPGANAASRVTIQSLLTIQGCGSGSTRPPTGHRPAVTPP